MNKPFRTFLLITAFLGLSIAALAQKPALIQKPRRIDVRVTPITVKINSLQRDTARINREIIAADRLRNRHIPGVSPLTMDSINRAQDSICLDLRSHRAEMLENLRQCHREKAKQEKEGKHPSAAEPKK